jgi:hypothetical protein
MAMPEAARAPINVVSPDFRLPGGADLAANTHNALTCVAAVCAATTASGTDLLEEFIALLFCALLSTTWLIYRLTVNLQARR